MMYELLVEKRGNSIVDVRPEGFPWKRGERDESAFTVVKMDLSDKVRDEIKRNVFEYVVQDGKIVHKRSGVELTEDLVVEPKDFQVSTDEVDAVVSERTGKSPSKSSHIEAILDLLSGEDKDKLLEQIRDRLDSEAVWPFVAMTSMHVSREKLWPIAMKSGNRKLIWAARYRGLLEVAVAAKSLRPIEKEKAVADLKGKDLEWALKLLRS